MGMMLGKALLLLCLVS